MKSISRPQNFYASVDLVEPYPKMIRLMSGSLLNYYCVFNTNDGVQVITICRRSKVMTSNILSVSRNVQIRETKN